MHVCILAPSSLSLSCERMLSVYFANTMNMHRIHTAREYIAAAAAAEACFGSSIIWVITVIVALAELIAQIMGELTEIISDSVFLYAHVSIGLICCLSMSI
jgi:hypothetical protein